MLFNDGEYKDEDELRFTRNKDGKGLKGMGAPVNAFIIENHEFYLKKINKNGRKEHTYIIVFKGCL